MKKIMTIAIIMVAGLVFMPNVHATYTTGYGTVEDATKADSKIEGSSPEITKRTDDTTVVKYSSYDLKVLEAAVSATAGDRPEGYAWVGVKVSYPTGVSKSEGYQVYVNGQKYEGGEKNDNDYTEYFGITAEKLKKAIQDGKQLEYTLAFDWDQNSSIDQTVLIQIDPMTVQLYKEHDKTTPLWTEEMAKVEASKVSPSEQKPTEEKDEGNPDTADINLYMLLGLIAISGCGLAYTYKKRFN